MADAIGDSTDALATIRSRPCLRRYQRDDVHRMLEILARTGRCLNLSEMRCGKLVEFIALCDALKADLVCVLIVAPLSTLWNVQAEFERWLGWNVHVNECALAEWEHSPARPHPVVYAVNKEKLRDPTSWVFPAHRSSGYDLLLVDEAHHFRGRNSAQTKGLMRLARSAKRIVFATGTPLMNGLPREIWPILHLLDPKRWPSFWRFMQQHAAFVPSYAGPMQDESSPWRTAGKQAIKEWLAPWVVRRTYQAIYPELPAQVQQTIPIRLQDWDSDHWQAYQELAKEWETTIGDAQISVPTKLALTLRLRQLAATPIALGANGCEGGKIKAVVDYLANVDGKVVCFCWHRATVHALSIALARVGMTVWEATGDDTPAARGERCRCFQAMASTRSCALIATIGALKEGISLDTARAAIFVEKSWVPADNEQAAARIMGPHQQGAPLVVSFVCRETIEERVERVLTQKHAINSDFLVFEALVGLKVTH